jgi:hypothetical protein
MKPNHILILLLLYVAALSGVTAYLEAHRLHEPQWFVVTTTLIGSLLVFWWYLTDGTARSYRRSPLLNVAVIAVAVIAVPYYLVRSREKGQRLKALAKFCGFALLLLVSAMVGSLPAALVT